MHSLYVRFWSVSVRETEFWLTCSVCFGLNSKTLLRSVTSSHYFDFSGIRPVIRGEKLRSMFLYFSNIIFCVYLVCWVFIEFQFVRANSDFFHFIPYQYLLAPCQFLHWILFVTHVFQIVEEKVMRETLFLIQMDLQLSSSRWVLEFLPSSYHSLWFNCLHFKVKIQPSEQHRTL